MNSNRTELLAAWIVAIALIGAMSAHALLPKTPSRVGPGVTTVQQRPSLAGRDLPNRALDSDLPLREVTKPSLAEGRRSPL
jgi:hypothetical protein